MFCHESLMFLLPSLFFLSKEVIRSSNNLFSAFSFSNVSRRAASETKEGPDAAFFFRPGLKGSKGMGSAVLAFRGWYPPLFPVGTVSPVSGSNSSHIIHVLAKKLCIMSILHNRTVSYSKQAASTLKDGKSFSNLCRHICHHRSRFGMGKYSLCTCRI